MYGKHIDFFFPGESEPKQNKIFINYFDNLLSYILILKRVFRTAWHIEFFKIQAFLGSTLNLWFIPVFWEHFRKQGWGFFHPFPAYDSSSWATWGWPNRYFSVPSSKKGLEFHCAAALSSPAHFLKLPTSTPSFPLLHMPILWLGKLRQWIFGDLIAFKLAAERVSNSYFAMPIPK